MKWAVLATWKMAYEGTKKAAELLSSGMKCSEAIITGISDVEDNPDFHSVGYGGRPDKNGHVVLDGGYMDGDTLHFGAVAAMEGYRSPIRVAHSLILGDANNLLVGQGAEDYAEKHGFEKRNNLTPEAEQIYKNKLMEMKNEKLKAYDGHDTVCFLAKDVFNTIAAGTSTSGLFMKEAGRVGDSPFPGNGYYADSKTGAAAATGMGEEIMKGALSYAAVLYMKQGLSAQEAADKAVNDLDHELKERNGYAQPMSLIVMDRQGNYGIGTNIEFTFTYASENEPVSLYEALPSEHGTIIHEL